LSPGENPKGEDTDNNNGVGGDGDDKRPLSSDLAPGESATVAELRKRREELGHARRLLEDPPDWLSTQLGKCREDPDRFIKPTCCNVAYEVYGTSSRWEEVKPVLEAHLEASE
jgi:hypothetical protein